MARIVIGDSNDKNRQFFIQQIEAMYPKMHSISELRVLGDWQGKLPFEPEIIIGEITFFGLSPFPTLEDLIGIYPDVLFILYGPILDGLYIRKLMELQVVDYLYRPVRVGEFRRVLEITLQNLLERQAKQANKEQVLSSYRGKIDLFLDHFMRNLTGGNIDNEFEIKDAFQYFHLPMKAPFSIMLIQLDFFKKIALTLDEMEKHVFVYSILQLVEGHLQELAMGGALIHLDKLHVIAVLLTGIEDIESHIIVGNKIIKKIKKEKNVSCTIGLSRLYPQVKDIVSAYKEARRALLYREYYGNEMVLSIDFIEPDNNWFVMKEDKKERFISKLVVGSTDKALKLLREFTDSLESIQGGASLYANIAMEILIVLRQKLQPVNSILASELINYFPTKTALLIETATELHDFFEIGTLAMGNYSKGKRESEKEALVIRVKAYQQAHFKEAISISNIAIHLQTTQSFLQEAMADYSDRTLYAFTMELRMNLAKELMATTNLADESIAVLTGYDDVRYFRSVFKKYVKLQTYEYRLKTQM